MNAVYVSANSFTVSGNQTSEFNTGRRLELDCDPDGMKYATIVSSSYSDPYTTVIIDESTLTTNLDSVLYGIVQAGLIGSIPDHLHDGSEGSGGTISGTGGGSGAQTFLELTDTPATYDDGKYLKSTTSGTEWATVSGNGGTSNHSELNELDYASAGHTGFQPSGDYLEQDGSTQLTGDWDYGSNSISGTGDIYCNDIYTASGTVYIGDLKLSTDGTNLLVDDSQIDVDKTLLELTDTPSSYSEGLYLKSTIDGIEWATASGGGGGSSDVQTFLDLDDTPTIYDEGKYLKSTTSGTEWSTVSGIQGADGEDGIVWYDGSGAPSSSLGSDNDYYLDNDTGNIYKKDLAAYGSDLFTTPGNASASDDDGASFTADKAIDNDGGTRWLVSTTIDQWWKYDYGTAVVVRKLRMQPQSSYVKDFGIYGSNDDSDWSLLGEFQHGNNGNWEEFEFVSNSTAYRYIRLDFDYPAWSINYFSIYEMESMATTSVDWQLTGGNLTGPPGEDAPTTFSGLSDTPSSYDDGKYLKSTISGTEWATISGGSGAQTFLELTDTPDYYSSSTISGSVGNFLVATNSGIDYMELYAYGSDDPPTASGLPNGFLYFKYIV